MARSDADPLSSEIASLFQRLGQAMHEHFAQSTRAVGLSLIEGRALFELEEPVPMGELAITLGCDASYVTGITDRLEERGLVERRTAAMDRRVKQLVITPAGIAAREEIQLRAGRDLPITMGLSADERQVLRDLLAKAVAARDAAVGGPGDGAPDERDGGALDGAGDVGTLDGAIPAP